MTTYIWLTNRSRKGNLPEIRTSTHWNLTGCSITGPPPVLSPSNILPQSSTHCAFKHTAQFRRDFRKCYFSLFRRVRIFRWATISFVKSVCLSVRMEQLGFQRTDSDENWNLSFFRKPVVKVRVSLNSDKNNGYFTLRPFDIYPITISRKILLRIRNGLDKSCRENYNTF
jgi:hypothetical protein